jgi:hypothetical protein
MEKVGVLIERLLEQYLNNAPKEQLRVTAQLLLAELDNKKCTERTRYSFHYFCYFSFFG